VDQGVISVQCAAEAADNSPLWRQGFPQAEPAGQQQYGTEDSQYAKNAAPTHDAAELATEYGSDHRSQSRYQKQP
jgi:hypothetical protein